VSRPRGERGALTPAVLILAIMIFWLAGLVIDGARQLNARSRAIAYAQEAARAGASGINLNEQNVEFDPKDVRARVDAYCAEAKANDDTVTQCGLSKDPDAKNLEVAVELKNPTTFLSMLGVQSLTAKGQGEAHAEQGINKADETPEVPSISVLPTSQDPGEEPKPSASTPTFDPPCTPNPPTVTITETTTSPAPTPPPPARPTATVTVTVTQTTTSPGPLPSICIPDPPGGGR
jgi:hypothetical protein